MSTFKPQSRKSRQHASVSSLVLPQNSHQSLRLPSIYSFPEISPKIGSLNNFLEEGSSESPRKPKKTRKLFVTMNEELSGSSLQKNITVVSEAQMELSSNNPRKSLLYDKHLINRRRAASKICESIVNDVKQQFKITLKTPRASEPNPATQKLEEIHQKTKQFRNLPEKLNAVESIIKGTYSEKPRSFKRKVLKNSVAKQNVESSPRPQRSPEDELMKSSGLASMLSGSKKELSSYTFMIKFIQGSFPKLLNLLESFDYEVFTQSLTKKLQWKSYSSVFRKKFVSINKYSLNLPFLELPTPELLFSVLNFSSYSKLKRLDLSKNKVEGRVGVVLLSALNKFSSELEDLDLSECSLNSETLQGVQELLVKPNSKLKQLRLQKNNLKDSGACLVAFGLLKNNCIEFCNLSQNKIEVAGGVALAKALRINRSLLGVNFSSNELSGLPCREISRALIINNKVKNLVMSTCGITDQDTKEFSHMLAGNNSIQELHLSYNFIGPKGIKALSHGISKNKKLVHLALSGNSEVKLKHLEALKGFVRRDTELDIAREEDFIQASETEQLSLMKYIE